MFLFSECQRRVSPRTAIPSGDNQDSVDLANKEIGCPERTMLTEFGLDKVDGGDETAYVYECCAFPKGRNCSASAKVDNAYTDYANAGNDGNAEKLADQGSCTITTSCLRDTFALNCFLTPISFNVL